MDMCLLCLELKQESTEGIEVTSTQWQNENIEKIIEQHFWNLNSITPNSWLCTNCWEIVKNFHNFYIRIEEAHSYFVPMLKTELLESSEDLENVTTKDLTEDNLQEIEKKQRVTTTKAVEENKQQQLDIKPEIINEEQPIAVDVEILAKTKHKSRDPLEKHLPVKNRKVRKIVKSEPEAVSGGSSKEKTTEDIENVLENNAFEERDNLQNPTDFIDDCEANTSSSDSSDNESDEQNEARPTAKEWKPRHNPYYQPRTKRKEIDEFLAKHYNITCVICQTPMPTFHELSKHFSKQHNEPAYVVCCSRKFLKCSRLVDHVHCHLEPEYFKCKHCGKIMSDRRCLELHTKTHGIQDKTHVCDICQKAFSRKLGLRNHKLIHLSDEEKKFACEQCGKLFGNKNLLGNHVRVVHLNKYALVCDICGEKMRGKDIFERHILKHKGVPIPTIACDVCGLKVTGQRGLKRHKDSQHPEGGRQEYPCHLCPQISPTLKAQKKHVKDKHELGYDFKCTMCEKAFKRSSTLKEHMATHTGTVLYTCSYCPKTFNSNANMHSHRKKSHPKEWEDECRAKYSGNLPPKYKINSNKSTTVTNEVQNNNNNSNTTTTAKWY